MDIKTVGVIGAGVMGTGVAQNLAQTGHQVVLLDLGDEILQKAREQIRNSLRFQALFNKAAAVANPEAVLDRIHFATDDQRLESADFVVENVSEQWEAKKTVYARLDAVCPAHCIFAANTSAISITRIASLTQRPTLARWRWQPKRVRCNPGSVRPQSRGRVSRLASTAFTSLLALA